MKPVFGEVLNTFKQASQLCALHMPTPRAAAAVPRICFSLSFLRLFCMTQKISSRRFSSSDRNNGRWMCCVDTKQRNIVLRTYRNASLQCHLTISSRGIIVECSDTPRHVSFSFLENVLAKSKCSSQFSLRHFLIFLFKYELSSSVLIGLAK